MRDCCVLESAQRKARSIQLQMAQRPLAQVHGGAGRLAWLGPSGGPIRARWVRCGRAIRPARSAEQAQDELPRIRLGPG